MKGMFVCEEGVDPEQSIIEHLHETHGRDPRLICASEQPRNKKEGDAVREWQKLSPKAKKDRKPPQARIHYLGPRWSKF
jgi:hypothetical protein